jgi:hypothetical protein
MQVDLSQNSLEKDAKVLLKSAAQAANCMLILDDSDREGEETLETQERTEGEEVDTVEQQSLEGQKGRITTTAMPSGAEAGAPAPAPWLASASLLIPASSPASISAPNPYGTYTADTAHPHMKKPLSPHVSLVAARKNRFESPSAIPNGNADYDA